MYSNIFLIILITISSNYIKFSYEFNLSPKPNLVYNEPNLKTYLPKYRSSYFGFTIVLRENSFIVGAPRAQSTLELQRKVNETGAIYKCSLKSQQCIPYVFDSMGNTIVENSEYTYDSERKDYQWLGASMDGGSKETDRLVVCAPRLLADLQLDYLMHGVCYWTPDTIEDKLLKINKISPLRLKSDQIRVINGDRYYYYMFGEQGISVHITENNEEIIIGAPGIHTWRGSLIRYSAKLKEDVGGLSRRESNNKLNHYQSSSINNNRLHKRENIEYVSEVLNPESWNQKNDSYFGYSVTSGFFDLQINKKQILYIASAPQANKQAGEVYLFDIIKTSQGYSSIKKYYTFHGNQFGEYFGYSVLAEDINNDGLTDVIVSAPLHSVTKYYDKGAIYVFMNKGKINFDNAKIITTKADVPGRFGTTITKLGDINHDGYNDIAVGAPFEDDGAVYIFLGSDEGLKDKPSQILKYPKTININKSLPAMFGHGISKGVDIDYNGFNDLAIGAPNSETVYIYKSYPVISIDATIKALSREIKIEQTKFQLSMCYGIVSTTPKIHEQEIIIELKADIIQNRVQFTNTKSNEMIIVVNAKERQECRLIDATVKFNVAAIFKPIDIEMKYKLKNEISRNVNKSAETEDFCETCAVVDPSISNSSIEKISFSTGCKGECVADMKIKSSGLSSSFVIGSSRTITVNYEITNTGENAYLPQINITSSNNMPFAKIPSHCEQNDFIMICNLYNKHPMLAGDKDFITIVFDANNIEGDSIIIQAEVFSTGKESNPDDNIVQDIIELKESSNVDIIGYSNPSTISLVDHSGIIELTNMYEIRNNGPSKIKEMNVSVFIPISYPLPNSNVRIPIIDFNTVKVNAIYYEKELRTDFYQNDVILLKNSIEKSSTPISIIENLYKIETDFDISLLNNNYLWPEQQNHQNIDNEHLNLPMTRKKRNLKTFNNNNKDFNSNHIKQNEKSFKNLDFDFIGGSLPINKTILFACDQTTLENTYCIKAMTTVYNFDANTHSILNVTIRFNADLMEINKILVEPLEFFVITTDLELTKFENIKSDSLTITKRIAHNIISKNQIPSKPIWIYIISILGGILVLMLISYVLHKLGFFKRKKKEELQKLHRESHIQQNEDTEDEG